MSMPQKWTLTGLLAGLLVAALPESSRAASGGTPLRLSHQGYLVDQQDVPVTGSRTLLFRLRTAPSATPGETLEWEASCAVAVRSGVYAVELGGPQCSGDGLDTADLPAGGARYLEVSVEGVTLAPRLAISSVPRAEDSARLGGRPLADLVLKSELAGSHYTRTEVDSMVGLKANTADVYSRTSVDSMVGLKANTADVYSRTSVDSMLGAKANGTDVYAKAAVDSMVGAKANTADVYSRPSVDSMLGAKANSADVYTKTEVDTRLATAGNSYSRTESDARYARIDAASTFAQTATFNGALGFGSTGTFQLPSLSNPSSAPCVGGQLFYSIVAKAVVTCVPGIGWKALHGTTLRSSCKAIRDAGESVGDGVYTLSLTGDTADAFQAYCLMDSSIDGGGWTMCYTTNDSAYISSELGAVTGTYGTNGYRGKCANIPFSDAMYVRHSDNDWVTAKNTQYTYKFANCTDTSGQCGNGGDPAWSVRRKDGTTYNGGVQFCGMSNFFRHGVHIASAPRGTGFGACNNWNNYSGVAWRTNSTQGHPAVAWAVDAHPGNGNQLVSVGIR